MQNHRSEYPVTNRGAYLMNAAIGGVHREVRDEIKRWSSSCAENGAIDDIRFFHVLEESREVTSKFLSIDKEDVSFSGSTSLNMNYLAMMLKGHGVKKLVAPSVEFPSSTVPWFHHNFEVELVEPRDGRIQEADLVDAASGRDSVVVCSGTQFLTGQRIDLKKLSDGLKKKESFFIINGTQHIGQFKLDLGELSYFAFTASLHKWLGADLGVSLLSIAKDYRSKMKPPVAGWAGVEEMWRLANEPPKFLQDMGSFQIGTMPFGMIAGAKRAMEVQLEIGLDKIESEVLKNSDELEKIIKTHGFELVSPRGILDRSGICTFKYEGDLDKALATLEENDVFVNGRRGCIRASIHFFNNEEDLSKFDSALKLI